jgi:hypothetical protein
MISDDVNHKSSNNIIILQQIEDCRDRNDTVLQFTVDPITFGYNTPANSSATPQYSVNDLKTILDEDLVKNFSLTSSSSELIFSAVNCSLLLCMRVLTALRKKSWIILTSNAYLDIYTNCIVKTFYFEKYSQSKLFSVTSPTALPNGSIPAFAPRTNLTSVKRSSTSTTKNADDPLSNGNTDGDYGSSIPRGSPTGRSQTPNSYSTSGLSNNHSTSYLEPASVEPIPPQPTTQAAPVRRESLRRQPPPPPSASTIRSATSTASYESSTAVAEPAKVVSPTPPSQATISRSNSSGNSYNDGFHDEASVTEPTANSSTKKATAARGSVSTGMPRKLL